MQKLKSFWKWSITHKKISIPALFIVLIVLFIFRPKAPKPIDTAEIKQGNITVSVSVSGTIAAKQTANLTFPIGGTISWVGVNKGDTVVAGQTIATLDQRTAQHNLQTALIAYSKQRNTFDQTIVNNNNIGSADNALNDNMKRILQNNQYDLNAAVNSVELSDLARQQSILSTPISGIVTRVDASVAGMTAVAGTTTFTVVDPTSIVFDMDVDEADIGKISMGQISQVVLDAYPDKTYSLPVSSIDFVSHTTTNGGNAYTVEVKMASDSAAQYRVGMNGNAEIITNKKENVLVVPLSSIANDNTVYLKTPKGFVKRAVKLGVQNDISAEVVSGLNQGDVVALDPATVTKVYLAK